jgi:hypothetical protein
MSYLYIKTDKFNINNLQIKIINDMIILNYNLKEFDVRLKNIIFNINNYTILNSFDTELYSFKLDINKQDILKTLRLIDAKLLNHICKYTSYKYTPIIKEDYNYNNFIDIYLRNSHITSDISKIDTYIMIKFKLINNCFLPRLYTYNVKLY